MTSPPLLWYPDFKQPFVLHTDACLSGLGAVLYQLVDGREHVIAYASRSLNKAEKKYPAHKLEFLALKWAVTKKFHDYLYGNNFTVYTDNNPLTYVLTTAKLDATGHRWIAALGMYNFNILYRSGKSNADADGLSRLPHQSDDYLSVPEPVIKALCQSSCCHYGCWICSHSACPTKSWMMLISSMRLIPRTGGHIRCKTQLQDCFYVLSPTNQSQISLHLKEMKSRLSWRSLIVWLYAVVFCIVTSEKRMRTNINLCYPCCFVISR